SVLRRVTTTSFLHSGFLISSWTMRPPTFPVAPSTTAEYCASPNWPRLHSVMIAHRRYREIRRDDPRAITCDQPVAGPERGGCGPGVRDHPGARYAARTSVYHPATTTRGRWSREPQAC